MVELAEELFEVLIKGPGPYGFRLYGGDGDPLIIAKLRARSKAHDAGLREGDVVLGINDRSCQTTSHGVAMTLLESAEDFLRLHLYRGSTDRNALLAAYAAVGNQLRPVSPGTVPPTRSIFGIQPSPPTTAESPAQPSVPEATAASPQESGQTTSEQTTSYSRQEVTSSEGGLTQKTTTETQDLGGVSLTRVTREVVKEPEGGTTWTQTAESSRTQRSTVFHVPKVKAQPLFWAPEGSASPGHFQVNKAITVELSNKENTSPNKKRESGEFVQVHGEPPKFKVYKTSARRWVWQPGHVPELPVREASPPMTFEVLNFQPQHKPEEEFTKRHSVERDGTDSTDPFGVSAHLYHVLTTEGTPDDYLFGRKKKIFADSAFYDDPEQKYPTIEEQIKMARKVALSLSAPDNITARGQRMFLKCKEKANQPADQFPDGINPFLHAPKAPSTRTQHQEEHSLYYNPTPWKAPQARRVERVVAGAAKDTLEGYPEDPEASSAAFAKSRSLFERSAGFKARGRDPPWKKALSGSSLAPQHLVGLTQDLKGMKGKGAKLFAKARAKAIEADGEWQSEGEAVGLRERSEERRHETPEPANSQEAHVSRLEELISISKSYHSPWESKTTIQAVLPPWSVTPIADEQPKKGGTDDFRKQKTTNDVPSFIAKKSSSGAYRPVKFNLFPPSDGHEYGITDF